MIDVNKRAAIDLQCRYLLYRETGNLYNVFYAEAFDFHPPGCIQFLLFHFSLRLFDMSLCLFDLSFCLFYSCLSLGFCLSLALVISALLMEIVEKRRKEISD